MLGGGGHKAQVGAAVAQGHTQRLSLAHGNVSAAVLGGLHDAQSGGVAAHDVHGTGFVSGLTDGISVLEQTVEVGLLDVDGSHIGGQHLLESVQIGLAVLGGDDAQLVIGTVAIGADGVDDVGVGSTGDQSHAALTVAAHGSGLGGGGGAVIDRGVGNVHAGQLADHGLILEDRLQNTLAHFGLIGGVGSQELFLGGNILDNAGDVMVISASTAQNGGKNLVLCRHGGNSVGHFHLAHPLGDVQGSVEIHLGRHIAVQIFIIVQTDGLEHLEPLRLSGGHIASHF